MKKSMLLLAAAAIVTMGWSIGRVQGQSETKLISVSPDQANFQDKGNGVSMAPIFGDADKGAHATFTKFQPGFDAGTHTHSNDV